MRKKSNIGIIILILIDVALLIAILVSASNEKERRKNDEQYFGDRAEYNLNQESDSGVKTDLKDNSDVGNGNAKNNADAGNEDSQGLTAEGDLPRLQNDEGNVQVYDTEGIEGIVDIEGAGNEFNISDYSTTEKPKLSDFMWYFDGVHYNGIPEDAVSIYDSEMLTGDWKGFIFYDPDRKFNSYALEFLNVNLDIQGQKAGVTFDLYQYCPAESEIIDVSGEKMSFSGNFEAGAVYATGGENVHIDTFYTLSDNKQYAVGYIDTVDGTPAYIALVRP